MRRLPSSGTAPRLGIALGVGASVLVGVALLLRPGGDATVTGGQAYNYGSGPLDRKSVV